MRGMTSSLPAFAKFSGSLLLSPWDRTMRSGSTALGWDGLTSSTAWLKLPIIPASNPQLATFWALIMALMP